MDTFSPELSPSGETQNFFTRDLNVVADLIEQDHHRRKTANTNRFFDPKSAAEILTIPIAHSAPTDGLKWLLDPKGTFSVKTAYCLDWHSRWSHERGSQDMDWRKLWKLKLQHRLRLLLWKVATNALLLHGNLARAISGSRPIHDTCSLCLEAFETLHHLFLGCAVSKLCW